MRVKAAAQPARRPGQIAEVVGISDLETEDRARRFDAPIGSKLYLIEFGDGSSIEIPASWIEVVQAS